MSPGVLRRKIPLVGNEEESNNIRSQYTEDTQRGESCMKNQDIIVNEECAESTLVSEDIRMSQKAFMSSTQTSQMNTIVNRPMILKSSPNQLPTTKRNTKTGEQRKRHQMNLDIKDFVNDNNRSVQRTRRMKSNFLQTVNRGLGLETKFEIDQIGSQITDETYAP